MLSFGCKITSFLKLRFFNFFIFFFRFLTFFAPKIRCALVSNVHLSVLAQKLQLDKYFVYVHAQDLARKEDLNNALANCFEGTGRNVQFQRNLIV